MTFLALLVIQGTYVDQFESAAEAMRRLPLSHQAAKDVARGFFLLRMGGCGGTGGRFVLDEDTYAFASAVGVAGRPGPTIWVNRRTGAAWAKGRGAITDRRVYLDATRRFRDRRRR